MPTYKTAKNVSHIFDCRGQFFLKWEQQSIFPLFQNSSKNWMTFSHPNFNFMGCYTGQGVFFSRRPFFLSQSFHSSAEFTAVPHYYSVMFHLIFVIWGLTDTLEIQKLTMCLAPEICCTCQFLSISTLSISL